MPPAMKKKLVVFDFDGTITYRDSMLEFTKFYHGNLRFYLGMLFLLPVLIPYKIGLIPNWKAKEYFLAHFFSKEPLSKFQEACDRFGLLRIPSLIRPAAFRQLAEHQKNGDQLVIVSSSAENWLRSWCEQQGIRLIGTRLETQNGRITGKLKGLNCYGEEKVRRLKERFQLDTYVEIITYGDSKGDFELFQISSQYFYKPFRKA